MILDSTVLDLHPHKFTESDFLINAKEVIVFITANANLLLSLTSFNGYVTKISVSLTDVPLTIIIL